MSPRPSVSPARTSDLTATALRVNRLFALMMPVMMVILNLSSVAVVWFGGQPGQRGLDADREPHRIPDLYPADPDVGDDGRHGGDPAPAGRGERGTRDRGARHRGRSISDPAEPTRPERESGRVRFENVSFAYPGSERAVVEDLTLHAPARRDERHHRGHGQWQDDAAQSDPALLRRHRGQRARQRRRRARSGLRRCSGAHIGIVPAGVLPLQRNRGEQPALRARATPPTRSSGALSRSPRPATSSWRCPARSTRRSTRVARTSRAANASASPSRGPSSNDPSVYLFDDCFSALTPRPTRACAPRSNPSTGDATVVIVAQRVSTIMHADQIIVLEDDGRIVGIGHARGAARRVRRLPRDRRLPARRGCRTHEHGQ